MGIDLRGRPCIVARACSRELPAQRQEIETVTIRSGYFSCADSPSTARDMFAPTARSTSQIHRCIAILLNRCFTLVCHICCPPHPQLLATPNTFFLAHPNKFSCVPVAWNVTDSFPSASVPNSYSRTQSPSTWKSRRCCHSPCSAWSLYFCGRGFPSTSRLMAA